MGAAVAVLAAGSGTRVGADRNKILLPLDGRPVLAWSVLAALEAQEVTTVIVVCRPGEEAAIGAALTPELGAHEVLLTTGGSTRHASEQAALNALEARIRTGGIDVVAIHDGARPLATSELFDEVIRTARAHGGAVPTVDLPGLSPRTAGLVGVQTPQAFRAPDLLDAYSRAAADGFEGTDTAATVERYADLAIHAVPTGPENLKVTYAEDLSAAAALLTGRRRGV
ncbi:IspD/TarI family cytidylyltransferase [Nocardioides montaniterrae]